MYLSKNTILFVLPFIIIFLFLLSFSVDLQAVEREGAAPGKIIISKEITNNPPENADKSQEIILSQARAGDKEYPEDPDSQDKETVKKKKTGLKPLVIRGTRDRKKKDIQTISRQTMTAEDIKETPASFGDSISAITALPGIMRAFGGFFGPLVIRGADMTANNYFVDDIPIQDPMHFGGLHSVINTNIISEVDVYSSAFPARFGSATAAIIDFTTIDEVNEFGGYTDLSLLSAAVLIKAPILRNKLTGLTVGSPSLIEIDDESENKGYLIGSARYGYITLGIKAAELITGDKSPFAPEYWDYQVKTKYKFDSVNSITMLLFGHRDFFRLLLKDDLLEDGDDPLLADMKFRYETMNHNQGLYFDSNFSKNFSNRFLYFSSLPDVHSFLDFGAEGAAPWAKDLGIHYRPWIFGLKDKFKIKWLFGHAELTGGPEYTFYYFTAKGKSLIPSGAIDVFDLGDPETFRVYYMDKTIKNHQVGGYLENKFTYGGLTIFPGIRSEYLARVKTTTYDPRLMTSYKFPTNTTISAAGGHYSYFFQTNPFLFNQDPDLASISKKVKPEKAWHSSVGIEQEIDLFTIKVEGFNNYFYDMPMAYPHKEPDGTDLQGLCSGKQKAYGFEIMLRKDLKEKQDGIFGWLSYTYTRSKFKSGLPTTDGYAGISENKAGDPYGDRWMTSEFEQRHCLKLVAGWKISSHTLSGKAQYYSGAPYTPITGYIEDSNYALNHPGEHRYIPTIDTTKVDRNSKNFPPYYQLDLRYTYKTEHSWGYVSWYVEFINVFMKSNDEYKWYWNKPYSEGSNPKIQKEPGFNFLPNFGVEVKF